MALILLIARVALAVSSLETIKLSRTRAAPLLSIRKEHRYHLFLSHVWSTGQDQVAVIKRQLLRMVHGLRIFLDVVDLEDIGALEKYVDESMVILVFLSHGYFCSRNCLREIKAAKACDKPLLLVLETNDTKGGLTLEEAREECPQELREYVFGPGGSWRAVIPWHRITVFQLCTLKEVVRQLLVHTPLYASEPDLSVYLDSDVDMEVLKFWTPMLLYASPNNPGCAAAAKEVTVHFSEAELKVVEQAPAGLLGEVRLLTGARNAAVVVVDTGAIDLEMSPSGEPDEQDAEAVAAGEPSLRRPSLRDWHKMSGSGAGTSRLSLGRSLTWLRRTEEELRRTEEENLSLRKQVFLLYLNSQTFVGELGQPLAAEVGRALKSGASIVMLHENDRQREGCDFAHFFTTTPRELIDAGLYTPLAVGLYPRPHRDVSMALVAQALGAGKKPGKPSRSGHNTTRAKGGQQAPAPAPAPGCEAESY